MNDKEAQIWLATTLGVPRGTIERVAFFLDLLREENQRQNLVSGSSLNQLWARHVVDSAQLLQWASNESQDWLDLGTGAGFPGVIVAMLGAARVTMVEQRRLRADFLERALDALELHETAQILCTRVERLSLPAFDIISARAFAPLDKLLASAEHLASPKTRWILPKGQNAKRELEASRASWQGAFRLEPSCTDPEAFIIVADQVRRTSKRKRGP